MTKVREFGRCLSKFGIVVGLDYPGPKLVGSPPKLFREGWGISGKELWEMHEC